MKRRAWRGLFEEGGASRAKGQAKGAPAEASANGGGFLRVRSAILASVAGATLAASLLFGPFLQEADAEKAAAPTYGKEEMRILSLLNDYRAENGLPPLVLSDAATIAAEKHNRDLARYGYTGHKTKESDHYESGSRSWDRMEAEGYPEEAASGENLAYGQDTPKQAIEAWKDSEEGHNENMLDERWKVVGISHVEAPDGEYDHYWATDFGGEVDETAHKVGDEPATPNDGTAPPDPSETTPPPSEPPADDGDDEDGDDRECAPVDTSALPRPSDAGFGDALREAIQEKVSCELDGLESLGGETNEEDEGETRRDRDHAVAFDDPDALAPQGASLVGPVPEG